MLSTQETVQKCIALFSVLLLFPIHKTFHPSVATASKPQRLHKSWIISAVSNKKENI